MNRRGMTLLELIIAIALVAALFGALFTFLFDLLSARVRVLEHDGRQLAATTLIEALESDLAACIAGDPSHGAGVRGDETSLNILTRGTAAALADRGPDDPAVFGDLQRSEYRFDAGNGRLSATRAAAGVSAAASVPEDLGGMVHKLRFRYHDGQRWADSFDSIASGGLPVAVEVSIWFDPWPGSPGTPGGAGGAAASAATQSDESDGPLRRTFDADSGFDERAYALSSDLDTTEPRPDRLRVIAILDPGAGSAEASEPAPGEGSP